MQADRLMRDMHKLCCHDLPNQLVVAQTLVQLLAEDEADRLSVDGLEFVKRLQSSLGAAGEMTRVLRELVKLGEYESNPTQFEWANLVRDWRASIAARFADCPVTVNCLWDMPTARGDIRALTRAVLEFLALVLPTDSSRGGVELGTEDRDGRIAFTCRVNAGAPCISTVLETRIEWLLIRNWLEAAGAELASVDIINDQACFVILLAK